MMLVILITIGILGVIFIISCAIIGAWAHQNDLKFEKNKDGKTVMSYRPKDFSETKTTKDK